MKGIILLEFIVVIIGILIFAFGLLAAYTINESMIENSGDVINTSHLYQAKYAMDVFNPGLIFILVGLIIAMVVGAFTIQTHPVFAVASFLILIFVIILAAVFGNVFSEYVENPQMSEAAASFSTMTLVFQNLPLIILAAGVLIMVVLYGKSGGGTA